MKCICFSRDPKSCIKSEPAAHVRKLDKQDKNRKKKVAAGPIVRRPKTQKLKKLMMPKTVAGHVSASAGSPKLFPEFIAIPD